MKRIDTATKAEDLFGAGKHGFKNGDVLTGEQPTVLTADWYNHVQEELAAIVEVVIGTALNPASRNQIATGLAAIIDTLAPKASPEFTGNPRAPTRTLGDSGKSLANTEFVANALAALVASSPAALDTLNELAAALGNDPNFATTMVNALAGKYDKIGGILTGVIDMRRDDQALWHRAPDNTAGEIRSLFVTRGDGSGWTCQLSTRGDGANGVDDVRLVLRNPVGPVRMEMILRKDGTVAIPADGVHSADAVRKGQLDLKIDGHDAVLTGTPVATTQDISSNSTGIATTAFAKMITPGWGQAWQNVTGSRAASTSYQNTTGKQIVVSVFPPGGVNRTIEVSADNVDWVIAGGVGTAAGAASATVPPGHYYRCNGGFTTWTELR